MNNKALFCIGNGLGNMVYNEGYCNDLKSHNTSSSTGLSKTSITRIMVAFILLVIIGETIAFSIFKNNDIGSEFSEKNV